MIKIQVAANFNFTNCEFWAQKLYVRCAFDIIALMLIIGKVMKVWQEFNK